MQKRLFIIKLINLKFILSINHQFTETKMLHMISQLLCSTLPVSNGDREERSSSIVFSSGF